MLCCQVDEDGFVHASQAVLTRVLLEGCLDCTGGPQDDFHRRWSACTPGHFRLRKREGFATDLRNPPPGLVPVAASQRTLVVSPPHLPLTSHQSGSSLAPGSLALEEQT